MLISFLKKRSRSFFVIYFIITGICCAASELFFDPEERSHFYFGLFLFCLSFLSLLVSVHFFFLKKNIALLLVLIVLKWPVLIYIIYQMTKLIKPNPVYLSAGVFPLVLSAFLWSLITRREVT